MIKKLLKFSFINNLRSVYKLNRMRRKWGRRYPQSSTVPMNVFPLDLVEVGNASYGELNVITFNNLHRLKIGSYVSIAQEVKFLLDVEHYLNHISTYPFRVKTLNEVFAESFGKGDIIVDDDCWIGYGSIILSGVHVGRGAVVAAGAVVTHDVPPYSIVGGVPAKIIKYRFDKPTIEKLMKIDYSKFDKDFVRKNLDKLYKELNENTDLSWLPVKPE